MACAARRLWLPAIFRACCADSSSDLTGHKQHAASFERALDDAHGFDVAATVDQCEQALDVARIIGRLGQNKGSPCTFCPPTPKPSCGIVRRSVPWPRHRSATRADRKASKSFENKLQRRPLSCQLALCIS